MNYRVICHHGILGQKWGIRRFQNRDGTLTSAGKQRKETERKGLSDTQKKILKGALITAGAAAVVGGGIYLAKTGKLDKLIDKGKGSLSGNSILNDTVQSSGNTIHYDDLQSAVKDANKVFGTKEGTNGCVPGAIAGCLRKLGIDAESKGSPGQKQLDLAEVLSDCFPGRKEIPFMTAQKFGKSRADAEEFILNRMGKEDSFGAVGVQWLKNSAGNSRGGHTFLWEVKDGKVSFCDTEFDDKSINKFWNLIDPNNSLVISKLSDIDKDKINYDNLEKYGVHVKR